MASTGVSSFGRQLGAKRRDRTLKESTRLLLLTLPFVAFILLFYYVPLSGWYIAFVRYYPGMPFREASFVGFANFAKLFRYGTDFGEVMLNTFGMSFLQILTSPLPMLFAILLAEVRLPRLQRLIQTGTTLPHFISFVIVFSIFMTLFSFDEGLVNVILDRLGVDRQFNPLVMKNFTWVFQAVIVNSWKNLGWGAIVYIAAMAGIPTELYEAATIDGATRFRQIVHITIPSLLPTYLVLLVLHVGNMLSGANFQQIFVFHNPIVASAIETLDYYVYRIGLTEFDFSLSTAIGVFKTVVSVALLFTVNSIARRLLGRSVI